MKTRVLSLFIVATFLISTTLLAQPTEQGSRNPERKSMMMKKFAQQKNIHQEFFTDEQQEAMKTIRLETAQKVKPFKNELRELMAHQQTLTTADNADLKAINKNIDKMSVAKTEIAKVMASQHQQIRSLLTDEQLLRFDAIKNSRGKKPRGDSMRPHRRMGA